MSSKKKIEWSGAITIIQGNVLEALARYKFLTMSQMLKLNIGTTQYNYLSRQIKSLNDRKKALIKRQSYQAPQVSKGRIEGMYFLTKRGHETLVYDLHIDKEKIKMPIGKTMAYRDYFHRKYTIDYQIALDKWAKANNANIPFFDTYFDKIGNNRVSKNLRSKTRITFSDSEYFIPDGVYFVEKEGKKRLHLMEMYNGKDTGRVVKQLHKHGKALSFKYSHKQFNIDENISYTIALVFEFESIMKATIDRIQEDGSFVSIAQYFLCKTLQEVNEGKLDMWVNLNGEQVKFR